MLAHLQEMGHYGRIAREANDSGDKAMAELVADGVMVCTDCIMVIANGDYSGLDFYDDADDRAAEVDAGLDKLSESGAVTAGDSEHDREFSSRPCDCCGTLLAGHRHHCIILN